MASGKTHDLIAYLVLPPIFGVSCFVMEQGVYLSLLVTIGAWFGGIYLSPDLDTRSRPFYRWGLFRFIWWPYHWLVPHRSSLSHGLFIAPLFRLIYFSAVLILAYFLFKLLFTGAGDIRPVRTEVNTWLFNHRRDFWFLGIGVWIGSLCHVVVDGLGRWLPFGVSKR